MTPRTDPGDRLERALAVFLAAAPTSRDDGERLLADHRDLADLLAPMLGRDPAAEVPPGERVLGDFRLVREIGRGGMGVVHEAWQRSLDRRVAVKVLAPHLTREPSAVARFRREAAAVARLRHPNVVEVFGCGSDGDTHFFAMQFVDGLPLHDCRSRFRDARRAVTLVAQLADALAHAHAHGVVHRDVKPANVLVRSDDSALLTDFGVARDDTLPSLTREGGFLGTLDYASPEQVRGEPVDGRTDVWSLGVVLYELLAGRHPFPAPTQEALIRAILTGEPTTLAGHPEIADDLAAIVARALTKDRAARYVSAAALRDDLRAFARGEPVTARLPTWFERTLRWARREPWQAVAFAALALGCAATATGFVHANRIADENGRLATAATQAKDGLASKVAEFELLAGIVELDRALAREATLQPSWPDRVPALRAWLTQDCARLEALQPRIVQGVQALRAMALPRTPAERDAERASHPRFAELQGAQRQRVWLQAQQRASATTTELPLPASAANLGPAELNDEAWRRIAPQLEQRTIDTEPELGLAYARAACARGAGHVQEYEFLDTLAWALAANGREADAVAAAAAARAKATPAQAAGYEAVQRRLVATLRERAATSANVDAAIATLDAEVDTQRTFRLADTSAQYLHDMLSGLLVRLDALFTQTRPRVQQRLAFAERVGDATYRHPQARVTWEQARAAIAAADDVVASAAYRGQPIALADAEIAGLVPIGMNPRTRLWEFYDLRSACEPGQDPSTVPLPSHDADGRIAVTEATGIVFVLLPGGPFAMGAQAHDPAGPNHDPEAPAFLGPVTTVTLTPFFCARHEITQAQWARLCDGDERERHPSGYPAGALNYLGGTIDGTHPVERVGWTLAMHALDAHGMTLPTEAQWEYACRAHTTTPWWTGATPDTLAGAANHLDLAAVRGKTSPEAHEDFDDGHVIHAPVGSFRANPFGLFDLHGNVGEWCLDAPALNSTGFVDGDGHKRGTQRPDDRTYRGGSYQQQARPGRASMWMFGPRETRAIDLGVRAVRRLGVR